MQLINENIDREYTYMNEYSCIGYYQIETKKYYYNTESECKVHIRRMQKDGWKTVEVKEKINISIEVPKLTWYAEYVKKTVISII